MIPQIEPWIDEEELEELKKVIQSTWVTEYKKTEEFENKIKELTGAQYAIAVSNGTAALYVALKVLGIGEGDEVIVPDFTFIATPNSVKMAGGTPIMVDVDRKTFNIDPVKIEAVITEKTKAIMPVHIFAQSADMDAILRVADKYKLPVVEDAAQGVGVYFNGKHTGTFGKIGVLSFYGNKVITTGEGGVILTDEEKVFRRCWQLKNHGREVKGTFIHPSIGFNFCFTELQAAIGVAQMRKLPQILENKKYINDRYRELLIDAEEVKFAGLDDRGKPAYWFTNILVDDVEGLAAHLMKNEIQTRRFYYPTHMQQPYKDNVTGKFPNSEWIYEHGLSLPSSATLKEEQIKEIADTIKEFYNP